MYRTPNYESISIKITFTTITFPFNRYSNNFRSAPLICVYFSLFSCFSACNLITLSAIPATIVSAFNLLRMIRTLLVKHFMVCPKRVSRDFYFKAAISICKFRIYLNRGFSVPDPLHTLHIDFKRKATK